MVFVSLTEQAPLMLWLALPTDGETLTDLPVSIFLSVVASNSPTPPSVVALVMSEKLGMSSSP